MAKIKVEYDSSANWHAKRFSQDGNRRSALVVCCYTLDGYWIASFELDGRTVFAGPRTDGRNYISYKQACVEARAWIKGGTPLPYVNLQDPSRPIQVCTKNGPVIAS